MKIMEISEALKNIRNGYIAALVSAGITVVLNFLQFDAGDVNRVWGDDFWASNGH